MTHCLKSAHFTKPSKQLQFSQLSSSSPEPQSPFHTFDSPLQTLSRSMHFPENLHFHWVDVQVKFWWLQPETNCLEWKVSGQLLASLLSTNSPYCWLIEGVISILLTKYSCCFAQFQWHKKLWHQTQVPSNSTQYHWWENSKRTQILTNFVVRFSEKQNVSIDQPMFSYLFHLNHLDIHWNHHRNPGLGHTACCHCISEILASMNRLHTQTHQSHHYNQTCHYKTVHLLNNYDSNTWRNLLNISMFGKGQYPLLIGLHSLWDTKIHHHTQQFPLCICCLHISSNPLGIGKPHSFLHLICQHNFPILPMFHHHKYSFLQYTACYHHISTILWGMYSFHTKDYISYQVQTSHHPHPQYNSYHGKSESKTDRHLQKIQNTCVFWDTSITWQSKQQLQNVLDLYLPDKVSLNQTPTTKINMSIRTVPPIFTVGRIFFNAVWALTSSNWTNCVFVNTYIRGRAFPLSLTTNAKGFIRSVMTLIFITKGFDWDMSFVFVTNPLTCKELDNMWEEYETKIFEQIFNEIHIFTIGK